MDEKTYKRHIICNIFPQIDDIYLGTVFTPAETLVCCANSVTELKKSLDIAIKEICDYVEGKISETEFIQDLQERERIMRGVIAQHNIPLVDDLYLCLTEYFQHSIECYYPFEEDVLPHESKSVDSNSIKTIGKLYGESKILSPDADFEVELPSSIFFTPMWDSVRKMFVPFEIEKQSTLPFFYEHDCLAVCERLTFTALNTAHWQPKAGEVYYHPITWNEDSGCFIPMDNQATFDNCTYPAFQTKKECEKVCDELTGIVVEEAIRSFPDFSGSKGD